MKSRARGDFNSYVDAKSQPTQLDGKAQQKKNIRYCPECGGAIKELIAKYCYHCGIKIKENG